MKPLFRIPQLCFGLLALSSFQASFAQNGPKALLKEKPTLITQRPAAITAGAAANLPVAKELPPAAAEPAVPAGPPSGFPKMRQYMGPGTSGGGNALVCFKSAKTVSEIKKEGPYKDFILDSHLADINYIETFDLYEALKPRGFNESAKPADLIQPFENETLYKYTTRLAGRIKSEFPFFYQKLMEKLKDMSSHRTIVTDDRIDQVYDINPSTYVDKPNCLFATLAVQMDENDLVTVYVDSKLFHHPLHSKLSKAVLYLHEAVYALARKADPIKNRDSRATRYLVALLVSRDVTVRNFQEALNSMGILDQSNVLKVTAKKMRERMIAIASEYNLFSPRFNTMREYNGSWKYLYSDQMREKVEKEILAIQSNLKAVERDADISDLALDLRLPEKELEVKRELFKNFRVEKRINCTGSYNDNCPHGITGANLGLYMHDEIFSEFVKRHILPLNLPNADQLLK